MLFHIVRKVGEMIETINNPPALIDNCIRYQSDLEGCLAVLIASNPQDNTHFLDEYRPEINLIASEFWILLAKNRDADFLALSLIWKQYWHEFWKYWHLIGDMDTYLGGKEIFNAILNLREMRKIITRLQKSPVICNIRPGK